jgi:hypothetical protein
MKKEYYISAIVILFIISILGCTKETNPVSDQPSSTFEGLVVDGQGNIIEGAGIHYIFSMSSSPLAKVSKTCPSTLINYTISQRTKVTIKLYRWYTLDSIATILDDTVNAGTHAVTYDVTKLTNGIYICKINTDTTVQEMKMMLLNADLSILANSTPLVSTNSSGTFSLPYGIFGFNVPFTRTSAAGSTIDTEYISHTIQIVVCKSGYATSTKSLTIDETKGTKQTFTLVKQ